MQKIGWDGFDLLTWGSLLGGYRSAAALEPLVRSGRLLGASAARRTAETSRWFLACIEDGGMRRGSEGWRLSVHSPSLTLVMAPIFAGSWVAQSIAGRSSYNEEQLGQLEDPVSWLGYVTSADFWGRTLHTWQSEFLAVAAMAIFAVYLRQRGSPESKPVGSPHSSTGSEE